LSLIDFQKLSEKVLEECKNEFIPPQYISEAALALCAKLRRELDESKVLAKSYDYAARPYTTTTSSYVSPYRYASDAHPSYTSRYCKLNFSDYFIYSAATRSQIRPKSHDFSRIRDQGC
jgi:hypothetical protein